MKRAPGLLGAVLIPTLIATVGCGGPNVPTEASKPDGSISKVQTPGASQSALASTRARDATTTADSGTPGAPTNLRGGREDSERKDDEAPKPAAGLRPVVGPEHHRVVDGGGGVR